MAVSLSIGITQNSQNVANNTSNVTVSITAKWTYGSFNRLQKSGYLIIDGTKYNFTSDFNSNATNSGSEKIFSQTVNIAHNTDGSKTVSCSAYYETGGNSGNITATASKTLTKIPRQATITNAPNFNDEANPLIKYSNPAGSSVNSLQAAIYGSNGTTVYAAYRDISKTGTSYTFSLTTAERNALRNAIPNSKSMTVRFYVRTVIGSNTYTSYVSKTFSITNANPTISPTIIDTNSVTAALTGNTDTLIRYFSNAKITFGASAVKGASVKSRKVTCGNKSITADGTINAVESGSFQFTVTDSRGYTTTKTVSKSIVNYIKLTCGLSNTSFNTDGVIGFRIKGNYFNSSFGTTSNVLIVEYRYKEQGGSYGNWVAITPTVTNNTYTANVSISGLDYQKKYIIQARAVDELTTIPSSEKTMSCVPVFDIGENDIQFNVPVVLANNNRINAITTDGTLLNAFQGANQNNNCVVGYGGYDNGIGATNLYGNDVNILTNTDLTVNDGSDVYSILGAVRAMSKVYELNCTVTAGSGYSDCSATAFLIGNNLRMYMTATRSSNANTGDVANETVMTIKVTHNGKIASLYGTGFASATTGTPATFHSTAQRLDDNNHTITISLCGVSVADNGWSGYWCLPCTLDLSKYI